MQPLLLVCADASERLEASEIAEIADDIYQLTRGTAGGGGATVHPLESSASAGWHGVAAASQFVSRLDRRIGGAQRLYRTLMSMDLDGDGMLSFEEWMAGVLANREVLHLLCHPRPEAALPDLTEHEPLGDDPDSPFCC